MLFTNEKENCYRYTPETKASSTSFIDPLDISRISSFLYLNLLCNCKRLIIACMRVEGIQASGKNYRRLSRCVENKFGFEVQFHRMTHWFVGAAFDFGIIMTLVSWSLVVETLKKCPASILIRDFCCWRKVLVSRSIFALFCKLFLLKTESAPLEKKVVVTVLTLIWCLRFDTG